MTRQAFSTTDARRFGGGRRGPAFAGAAGPAEQQFLDLLNAARADPPAYGRTIGVDLSAAAARPPLSWSPNLAASAAAHCADMAANAYFGHQGSDGSDPGQRMASAGYAWTVWAESIAAGTNTPAETLASLIRDAGTPSLGHRKMLLGMGAPYNALRDAGVAFLPAPKLVYGVVWTIDAAASVHAPQPPPPGPPAPPPGRGGPWPPRPPWWPRRWPWPTFLAGSR